MKREDSFILLDMLNAAHDAHESVQGTTYEQFHGNREKHQSVVFNIQQIGEHANNVSNECRKGLPDLPWMKIVGMRHRIVHDYDNVDLRVVWKIAMNDLPELISVLQKVVPKEKRRKSRSRNNE